MSLSCLANFMVATWARGMALAAASESVEIYREFAAANPVDYLSDFAASLGTLAAAQGDSQDFDAARGTMAEAIAIIRKFAAVAPNIYMPKLAGFLSNLANFEGETKNYAAAVTLTDESLEIWRGLAKSRHAACAPDLARALYSATTVHLRNRDSHSALRCLNEAGEILEPFAVKNPNAFRKLHQCAELLRSQLAKDGRFN